MIKRFATLFVVVSLVVGVTACNPDKDFLFDDYSLYVNNIYTYYRNAEEPDVMLPPNNDADELVLVDNIDGLTPINDYKFNSATVFFGDYAYVSHNENDYLIDIYGNMHILPENNSTTSDINTDSIRFVDNKIIMQNTNGFGVLNAFGKTIAPFIYESISTTKNVVLAKRQNLYDLYFNEQLLRTIENAENVSLLSDEYIKIDETVFTVPELAPAIINGFQLADAPKNGMVKIVQNGKFGFCNFPDGNLLIEAKYLSATSFSNGISAAFEYDARHPNFSFMGHFKLINHTGNTLYDFEALGYDPNEITVFNHYDKHSVYSEGSGYGAIRIEEETATQINLIHKPKNMRVYGDYIIFDDVNKFYSIYDNQLLPDTFLSIEPFNDMFIVETEENDFSLLDSKLNVLISNCENIKAYEKTVVIKKDGLFSLYKI